jgi:Ni/Fe-hydrogenase subunit HybB-like protein
VRLADMLQRGVLGEIVTGSREASFFLLEMAIGVVIPMLLLSLSAVRRNSERLYHAAVMAVVGVVVNRLNVSITGLESAQGGHYVPTVAEGIITLMLVGIGMAVFAVAVRFLPILPRVEEPELTAARAGAPDLTALPARS